MSLDMFLALSSVHFFKVGLVWGHNDDAISGWQMNDIISYYSDHGAWHFREQLKDNTISKYVNKTNKMTSFDWQEIMLKYWKLIISK